jgi:hypothetical protein
LNAPAAGNPGTVADFLNFQVNGTYKLKVDTTGLVDAVGGLAVGGTTVVTSSRALQNVTLDTSLITTGTLGVARGGTGAGTFTSNGILYGNGVGAVQATAAGTGGQVLLSNAGTPTFTTLGGDVASITSAGVLTIANSAITNAKLANSVINFANGTNTTVSATSEALGGSAISFDLVASPSVTGLTASSSVTSPLYTSAANLAVTAGGTGTLTLNTTDSASANTGAVTLQSGNATVGSNLNAGTVTVDTGTKTGGGTAILNLGNTNATTLNLGNTSSALTLNSTNFKVSSAGAISGVTTLGLSGAITGATSSNTINGLVINSGSLSSVGNITTSGASTWSTGANTLTLTSSNFNLNSSGVVTLAGAQTADITTATAGTSNGITVQPGISSAVNGTGAALLLKGGDQSGTTCNSSNCTGGSLTIQAGSATGASGTTRNGGNVSIDAGTGATANGTISIGATNATSISEGRTGITTTNNGALTVAQTLTANGAVSVAANQNVTIQGGTGVFSQTYSGSAATSAQSLSATNTNAGGSSVALQGIDITLVGTATSGGTNTNSALKFENPAAAANNLYYALNFAGTGYTDVLRVNGSQIISGTGLLQNAAIDNTLTYSNLVKVGALTVGSIASGFGTISTASAISTSALLTASLTGGNALAVTGAPTNSASSSLIQIGGAIASGNIAANGGTYIGLNAPSSGAGSAADFVNLQINGISKFKVDNTGIVNAAARYSVAGSASLTRSCGAGSYQDTMVVTGGIAVSSSGCTTPVSDARLKQNVVSLDGSILDKLKGVRAVNFDFDCTNAIFAEDNPNRVSCQQGRQAGVIAQELQQIFPELVFKVPTDDYYRVHYDQLAIYSLKATTELAQFIDSNGDANFGAVTAADLTAGTTFSDVVATNYPMVEQVSAGDVVYLDANGMVRAATAPFQKGLLGTVVKTANGQVAVATAGKVSTKVNGPVAVGDLLTSSSTPGVARVANGSGSVIGMATTASSGTGAVIMAVQNSQVGGGSGSSQALQDQVNSLSSTVDGIKAGLTGYNGQPIDFGNMQIGALHINLDTIAEGGLTVGGPAEFKGTSLFDQLVTFGAPVDFNDETHFNGNANFNNNTGGYAVINAGRTAVHVSFAKAYAQAPIISLTAGDSNGATFHYSNVTANGFDIVLDQPNLQDVHISWLALSVMGANTFVQQ